MKRHGFALALALCIGVAQAEDCALTGVIGVGGVSLEESSTDRAKLFEYRDASGGLRSLIDLTGCIATHTLKFESENLGRSDERLNLQGRDGIGASGTFKYQLNRDSLRHNFAFDARTPYSDAGSAQQSASFPNLNPAAWNTVDMRYLRRKDGAALEWNFNRKAYARFDASQTRIEGNKLQSYAQGTSPTQGFVDLATPVDTITRNLNLELGYRTGPLQLSLAYLTSRFENDTPFVSWSNGFFNGVDASPLAPENTLERWSASAVLRNLPLRSTLALRASTSRTRSATDLLASVLSTPPSSGAPGSTPATNPSAATFQGRVNDDDYAASLSTNLTPRIDTRLTFNYRRRENDSSEILFADLPTGLGCGDAPLTVSTSSCLNERLSYQRRGHGLDVGIRAPHSNRFNLAYEAQVTQRNRTDTSRSEDARYSVEWKNQALERISTRVKAQSFTRRADFASATLGVDATDPLYLQRYVARYDVTALNQTQLKFGVDVAAAPYLDLGAEVALKRNRYPDTFLGRTHDERREVVLTLAWGNPRDLRLSAFASWEQVRSDSRHRNINASTCPVIAPSLTPSPCFDPTQPATTTVYNWSATDRDRTQSAGLGVDWPLRERFVLRGSFIWTRVEGAVAVNAQALPSGALAADLIDIGNWGNSEHFALTLKGDYRYSTQWTFTGGVSYEELRVNDAQWNNATYLVPAAGSGSTTSYLSGAGARPAYTAGWVFVMGRYVF